MFSFLPSLRKVSWGTEKFEPEKAMADFIMRKDKKALEALYNAFANDLYHYLITLSDATLAKDIAQKTWLKVIEKPQNYHTAGNVKAWLFTMARNALIDEFRKTNKMVALDNNQLETELEFNFAEKSAQVTQYMQVAFDKALNALAFEQRDAFCLQQEGFSLVDIASMQNTKAETVKTRLRYAKAKLKQLMEQSYE